MWVQKSNGGSHQIDLICWVVQRAVIQMRTSEFHSYIGVKGNINVYNPVVKEGSSYAVMYVMNGADEKLNSITTGWMVI